MQALSTEKYKRYINILLFIYLLLLKWVPFLSRGRGGGGFWEVVMGVCRPALLISTLLQSNIYKVSVRECPPGDLCRQNERYQLLT